ncbi:hypothetical protein [Undibacterium sp.]|uniref:hypothetical protein n=1 Tax=Undibacterium sp. TaxID=1914977 RepID=UPI003752DA80
MSEIKPVFYVDATTLRCRTMDDISDESVIYYRRGDKVHETDVALYPESAIEALQKENFLLDLQLAGFKQVVDSHIESQEHYLQTTALNRKFLNENAALQKELAQAKEESQNYENATRIVHNWGRQFVLANGELRKANTAQVNLLAEIKQFLVASADGSMSRNNMQNLASELLESLSAIAPDQRMNEPWTNEEKADLKSTLSGVFNWNQEPVKDK